MSSNPDMQPTKAEIRTQAQRERILSASQACFVHSGFHAASMATIAETAGMSPGLIYRYFENKNAIVLAIIDHQLEVVRQRIGDMHSGNDLAESIVEHFDAHDLDDADSMSSVLFLEMTAEATRDAQVAQALQKFDATVRSELVEWMSRSLQKGGYGLPVNVARERVLMLVCLIEGLKLRKVREPALDRRLLRESLDFIITALVAPVPCRSR